jgi:Uma2 family endonuclease
MTYAQYVAAEATSECKHEWLRGEVFELGVAKPGGTYEHARLAAGAIAQLRAGLRDRPYRVFSADLRLKVEFTGFIAHPDVAVCGKLETASDDALAVVNPTVLIEVLSDSSEAYDRGEKFAHYRRIPSLREYVLLSQREPRIEVHRLNASGHWELHEALAGESIELTSLGCHLTVDEVYRDPLA